MRPKTKRPNKKQIEYRYELRQLKFDAEKELTEQYHHWEDDGGPSHYFG